MNFGRLADIIVDVQKEINTLMQEKIIMKINYLIKVL